MNTQPWSSETTEADALDFIFHAHIDPWAYEDRLIALIESSRRLHSPAEWKEEPEEDRPS